MAGRLSAPRGLKTSRSAHRWRIRSQILEPRGACVLFGPNSRLRTKVIHPCISPSGVKIP